VRILALAAPAGALICVSATATAFAADAISGAAGARSDRTSFGNR
jgi:hypothetical protein